MDETNIFQMNLLLFILPTSLQGNYGDSLGEFSNASYGVVGADRVKGVTPK